MEVGGGSAVCVGVVLLAHLLPVFTWDIRLTPLTHNDLGDYQYSDGDDVWKRAGGVSYALRYAGIGKRGFRPVSVATRSRNGKRRTNYAIKYGGIGKRSTDTAARRLLADDDIISSVAFTGLGDSSDVIKSNMAMKHKSTGTHTQTYDGDNKKITYDKRARNMVLKYAGIGKRNENDNVKNKRAGNMALKYAGIGKRRDLAAAYEHQDEKRAKNMALKYAGIGKRTFEDNIVDDKRAQNMALKYTGIGKRTIDDADTISDDKRAKNMAMKYAGIGKRILEDVATIDSEIIDANDNKRAHNFAMKYAGIGKRFGKAAQHDEVAEIQRLQALVKDTEQGQQQVKTVSHNFSSTSLAGRRTKRQVYEPLELPSTSHEYVSSSLLEDEPSVEDGDVAVTLDTIRQWLGHSRHSHGYYSSPLGYHLHVKRTPPNSINYGIRYVGIGR